MSKAITPKGKQYLSQFILIRHRRKLLSERRVAEIKVRELTRMRDDAAAADKSNDRDLKSLDRAASGLVFINSRILKIEKALGHPQR
jgi:hypothetical protein